MHYRKLGNSGVKVSAVSLGGWINYGEGKVAEDTARAVIETAYEHGINFFDIADVYGRGGAETQMGKVLAQYPRHTLVISSKVFGAMSDDINDRGLSRKHIMESIDKSLDRIGTDYLDIYFCHRPDTDTPIEETAHAMHDLITQGKVHYWGFSEWTPAQIADAYAICERYGWHKPRTEQPQYSMLHRKRVEETLLPVTHPRGVGLVVWSPLAGGMLTGKYDDGVPEDTRFGRESWAKDRYLNDETIEQVRQLKPIADDLGISRAQLALAWVLRQPGVSSVIIGATRPQQVIDNVKAADVELSADVITKIDDIVGMQDVS
jgi:voltage-dependent potassium channel beta subunit